MVGIAATDHRPIGFVFGGAGGGGKRPTYEAFQLEIEIAVINLEKIAEKQGPGEVAFGFDGLRQLFKGAGIGLRFDHNLLGAPQNLGKIRLILQADPQHQGIDQETDQVFVLRAIAAGSGDADHQIVRLGSPAEPDEKNGEQDLEKAGLAGRRQVAQRGYQLWAELADHPVAAAVENFGAGEIGRQGEGGASCEHGLAAQLASGKGRGVGALVAGKVADLQWQRRQRRRLAAAERRIKRRQLAPKHLDRAPIGDHVVQGD